MHGPNNYFFIQVFTSKCLGRVVGPHRLLREPCTTSMSRPNVVSLVRPHVLIRQPTGVGTASTWRRLPTAISPKAGYMALSRTNQLSSHHEHATPVVECIKVEHWKNGAGKVFLPYSSNVCIHVHLHLIEFITVGVQRWDREGCLSKASFLDLSEGINMKNVTHTWSCILCPGNVIQTVCLSSFWFSD